jgi:BMFP domain-containing protein YqiC
MNRRRQKNAALSWPVLFFGFVILVAVLLYCRGGANSFVAAMSTAEQAAEAAVDGTLLRRISALEAKLVQQKPPTAEQAAEAAVDGTLLRRISTLEATMAQHKPPTTADSALATAPLLARIDHLEDKLNGVSLNSYVATDLSP